VDIANAGGNTINNIRFTATARTTDVDERLTLLSVEGATCTATAAAPNLLNIECSIGQLRSGQSREPFAILLRAPIKDSASPIPDGVAGSCATTDCVAFSGVSFYAEGTGGSNSVPQNSTRVWASAPVTLGTFTPTLLKSAVTRNGGTLFTGRAGVTTADDRFTTRVTIPSALTYTTALIQEQTSGVSTCQDNRNFNECWTADITIPGTFSPTPLSIVLRQDAKTILGGAKIDSVQIFYRATPTSAAEQVGNCATGPVPRSDGLPCIAGRTFYRNKNVPGWTTELDGDFEWRLISLKNGSYTVF
jgi:hypothetical protein